MVLFFRMIALTYLSKQIFGSGASALKFIMPCILNKDRLRMDTQIPFPIHDFSKEEREKTDESAKEKRLISISPGGLKGFYMLGTATYIKEHYSLDNYIFSGASAGAWTSLFMTFRGEPIQFVLEIMEDTKRAITISDLEYRIKYNILTKYKESDFDLDRLFVGVTNLEKMKITTHIYSNFTSLEDAVNCCIASSHIPFITGGFKNIYNNAYSFDGGFSKYPYIKDITPRLHITPSVWIGKPPQSKNCISNISLKISDYTTLFSKDKYDYIQLFDDGYADAKKHKDFLDSTLLP